jgi:hypothetical protein
MHFDIADVGADAFERSIEGAHADRAPRARDVGYEIDSHDGHLSRRPAAIVPWPGALPAPIRRLRRTRELAATFIKEHSHAQ